MLRQWRLQHFKSVSTERFLELAPLTIFAGANSSGKSTVIQSILLTAQTLQSRVQNRPVILNGHIARLGAFQDIVSNATNDEDVLVGFELETDADVERTMFRVVGRRHLRRISRLGTPDQSARVECYFRFSAKGDSNLGEYLQLQPALHESWLKVSSSADDKTAYVEILLRQSSETVEQRVVDLGLQQRGETSGLAQLLDFEVSQLRGKGEGRWAMRLRGKPVGASLFHFLPDSLAIAFDAVEREVQQTVAALTFQSPAAIRELEVDYEENDGLNDAVRHILVEVLRAFAATVPAPLTEQLHLSPPNSLRTGRIAQELEELEKDLSLPSLLRAYRSLSSLQRVALAQLMAEREPELRVAVQAGRAPQHELRRHMLPELLAYGVDAIEAFFTSSLFYLGPLRDEPKPVYPLAGATDPRDVGFRGEHTAAVLDVNRNVEINYVPTSEFATKTLHRGVTRIKLQDAVLDWLTYMGVGSKISTKDSGKLGHELKIATADGKALHDLTQVGVGVSQVLPILVLALLAPPGSTLIFEQPELHLHPRVQTRLADFFVSMTQLSKQCIIETHSDALINRLRYRAAISEGREIADTVIMYFVEKHEGQSTYRKIVINEFGVIEDWPEGFFDESEETAAAILQAGIDKRRASRGNAHA